MPRGSGGDRAGLANLFDGIDQLRLSQFRAGAATRQVQSGSRLAKQGEVATHLCLLLEGRLKVTHLTFGGVQIGLGLVNPGDPFGYGEVMLAAPYRASVTAVSDCVVMTWTKAQVEGAVATDPILLRNILALVWSDAETLMSRLREQLTERVEQRIARALLSVLLRPVEDGSVETPPISRQDIAELTGTTHFTVSRILKAWEMQGIIANRRPRILIREPRQLWELAETGAISRPIPSPGSRPDRAGARRPAR